MVDQSQRQVLDTTVACGHLAVTATSASTERVLSGAGNTVTN